MLNETYFIDIYMTGISWFICLIFFILYNLLIVYFTPEIKKFIKEKLSHKKIDDIGFK